MAAHPAEGGCGGWGDGEADLAPEETARESLQAHPWRLAVAVAVAVVAVAVAVVAGETARESLRAHPQRLAATAVAARAIPPALREIRKKKNRTTCKNREELCEGFMQREPQSVIPRNAAAVVEKECGLERQDLPVSPQED